MKHIEFYRNKFPSCTILLAILALLFLTGNAAAANGITTMLRFPELNIQSGSQVTLKAYFYNESQDVRDYTVPENLSLRFQDSQGKSVLLTAVETGRSGSVKLKPGEFLTREYKVVLPGHYTGTMEISMVDSPDTEMLVNIIDKKPVSTPALEKSVHEANADYPSFQSLHSQYQLYAVNFSVYEPLYFLVGADPSESKFQISFRYRPLNPSGALSQNFPWLSGINFAYTQTSFWDLSSSSAPFEDTSYKPEIFYITNNLSEQQEWLKGFFFQGGVRHESNGQGGDTSRSTNTAYFKPIFIFYDADSELGFHFSPKLMAYFNNSRTHNPDFDDYRGNVEFEFKIGKASGLVSTTHLRVAKKGTSVETDLSYPISNLLRNNLDFFVYLQYSNSLAESMLNYKERTNAFRIGFSIVR